MGKQISENDIVVLQVVIFNPPDSQIAVLNNFYSANTPAGSGAVFTNDVCTAFDGIVAALYKALIWNTADYRGIRCRTVWPVLPPMDAWVVEVGNEGTGGAGAVGLPSQTCGLLRKISEVLGKKGEGRQYLPFPSTSDNETSGRPNATYQGHAAALGTALITPFVVTGTGTKSFTFNPCLFNPKDGPGPRITGTLTTTDWATQRRRGAYGRANLAPI